MSSLLDLTHHRWTLPVLSEIERTRGSRFATLTARLGVSGESLRRTLGWLVEAGLVTRNPGYGHPLRPEYVFTPAGAQLGPRARRLVDALAGHEDVALKKWSLPVLAELDGERRFSELGAALPDATARALALALKDLRAAGLVTRTVLDDYPPSVVYETTPAGRPIGAAAQVLRETKTTNSSADVGGSSR
jgi:DNA-binding HxlR family transcriptional regulator